MVRGADYATADLPVPGVAFGASQLRTYKGHEAAVGLRRRLGSAVLAHNPRPLRHSTKARHSLRGRETRAEAATA